VDDPVWFTSGSSLSVLSERQRRFLRRVDALLVRLNPPGASRSESWFSAEPFQLEGYESTDLEPADHHVLWLSISPAAARHEALEVGFSNGRFLAGWGDRHYAWDRPNQLLDRTIRPEEKESAVFDEIVEWIEGQLRRPAVVVRGLLGRKWAHVDEIKGRGSGVPAGFFDPPPF
jgi:hypothetical protein